MPVLQNLAGILLIALGAYATLAGAAGAAFGVPDMPPVLHPRKIAAGIAVAGLAAYAAGSQIVTAAIGAGA